MSSAAASTASAASAEADARAVCETVYRYATGIDTRDWALYRSIFADDVHIDFTSYNPTRPAGTMRADDWVASVRPLFTGLVATQHSMTNPIVEIDGDAATCAVYMQAEHVLDHGDDRFFTIGGHYRDTLVRTDGRWRITGVTLTVFWRRGDAAIMGEAVARATTAH